MTTFAQSEVLRIEIDINVVLADIAALQERLQNPNLQPIQRASAQANIRQNEARLTALRQELVRAQARVAAQSGVLPTPSKTAGQTVRDDASNNPAQQKPLETDPTTGRIQSPPAITEPSNADRVPTTGTGDADINVDGPPKTFSVTQSTSNVQNETASGVVLAPKEPEFPPGILRPSGQGITTTDQNATTQFDTQGTTDTSAPTTTTAQLGTRAGAVPAVTSGNGVLDDDDPYEAARLQREQDFNDIISSSTTNTNDSEPIKPQNNALDKFASYTYGVSVYLMTPQAYKAFVTTKKRTLNGSNLLFQSGGAPVSGTQIVDGITSADPVSNGRNAYFDVDFYIDSLTIDTLFPGRQTRAAHMASEIKFTVVEPNGITLLDRMYAAVQDHVPKDGAGKINYTAVQYMLAIRWYGYDRFGNLIRNVGQTDGLTDPNAAIEKFIPFRIQKINWGVTNKLVTYDFVCTPVGQFVGGGIAHATIPYDIELTDSTVGGLLGGDIQYGVTSPNSTPPTAPGAPQKANAAPSSKPTIRQGLMGAMNDFQQKLVKDKKYEYANRYEIVFANGAESIRDASVVRPQNDIKNLAATPMGKPVTSDPNGLDPRKNQVDTTLRNSAITAGQHLLQVIDLTIRNSTYITQQARVEDEEEPGINGLDLPSEKPEQRPATAKVNWFNITMEATPRLGEYDLKRNDFAYDIRYIISPYVVVNFDSKYFPVAKFNGLHKSYNYWFTGENTAVLDYQANYNSLYNLTITGDSKDNSAAELIRRKYTASMREIPTYVYQARSTESNFGADGRGNEISANAAEYLYSPGDLASAKVRIVGDPGWIQQGSLAAGVDPKNFDYRGFLPDGTINFDSQQVMFEIAWQRPEDYDINTGLADPYAGAYSGNPNLARQAIQSYVYQAVKCVSEFRQGKFEQTIEGSLYNFPIPQQQNTASTKTAGVSVSDEGLAERSSDLTTTSALALPSQVAALSAPPAPSAVQLSASGTPAGLPSVDLIRLGTAPTDSNGLVVQAINLPAPPRLGNTNDAITNTPSQQGVGSA